MSTLTEQQVAEALLFARQAVTDAGEIALSYFRRPLAVENKLGEGSFDPVTCADRDVESSLRKALLQRFPEYGVLGEEDGLTPGEHDINWVVDPIDGTKAFISGFPTWGVLLGLQQGGQVLAGLMYQPVTKELFYGSKAGAFLQHHGQTSVIETRSRVCLEEALLYCTHESMFANQKNLERFRTVAGMARLQRFGGDCYAYCMLALGQVDLVIEDTLQPYDIVPLIPIVQAAGGVITDEKGQVPVNGGFVVAAANQRLHDEVMSLL